MSNKCGGGGGSVWWWDNSFPKERIVISDWLSSLKSSGTGRRSFPFEMILFLGGGTFVGFRGCEEGALENNIIFPKWWFNGDLLW